MEPLVSVVLPTYNRAATLEAAIRSVQAQTFQDFELLVVDDGSTDGTPQLAAGFAEDARIRWVTRPHLGCSPSRNFGVETARGKYVAFQDSDDEWLPHKLETAVEALERSGPDVGVFYSDMVRVHGDGREDYLTAPTVRQGVLIDDATSDYQVYGVGIQSTVIRRSCFAASGPFDEALPRLIDLDLFVRMAQRFAFHHHTKPLVRYHEADGISRNRRSLVLARRHLVNKYRDLLKAKPRHLGHQFLLIAAAQIETGEAGPAYGSIGRAIFAARFHPITCRVGFGLARRALRANRN